MYDSHVDNMSQSYNSQASLTETVCTTQGEVVKQPPFP